MALPDLSVAKRIFKSVFLGAAMPINSPSSSLPPAPNSRPSSRAGSVASASNNSSFNPKSVTVDIRDETLARSKSSTTQTATASQKLNNQVVIQHAAKLQTVADTFPEIEKKAAEFAKSQVKLDNIRSRIKSEEATKRQTEQELRSCKDELKDKEKLLNTANKKFAARNRNPEGSQSKEL